MIRPSFHKPRPQDLLFPGPDPAQADAADDRYRVAPREGHTGILQHGGGGAAGRLVAAPGAGADGARRAGLGVPDLATSSRISLS